MQNKKSNLLIGVIVLIVMAFTGYRMRAEEEAIYEADKQADKYFEKLDSLRADTLR